ncbi:MAG: hypothetical protein OEU36_24730, partial [Gammaproteobacteria bacterium]|nr:hypothetical protein [Gammaproteobacteria bacterium]
MVSQVDYDLHGFVGVRLIGATPKDTAVVTRQLGSIQTTLKRSPDIVIRFVDEFPTTSHFRYLDVDDVGYKDDAFFVLRGKQKARTLVQIPFEQIGEQCEFVCEHGLQSIPLLIYTLNMTALANGIVPMHASAFNFNGTGVIAGGWAKGGKTETLLAFMANGAEYVGDEYVYLSAGADQMFGIPQPIRIWSWHLDYLPQYRSALKHSDLRRLRILKLLDDSMSRLTNGNNTRRLFPIKMINRLLPLLRKQSCVDLSPEPLFGKDACKLEGVPNKILFVASHESSDITIEPIDAQEIARRIALSLQQEHMKFMSYYRKFSFAFPDSSNKFLDIVDALQHEMLTKALVGMEAYVVYHPYPVSIQSLFDKI